MSPYGWQTYGEFIFCSIVFLWLFGKLTDRQARKRAYKPFEDHTIANAGFASDKHCKVAGLFGSTGFRLGYSRERGRLLRTSRDMHHQSVIGPTGTGKGSAILIPQMLDADGYKLNLIDPKCENTPIILRHRLRCGPVYVVNPYGVHLNFLKGAVNAKYNPLQPLCDGTIPRRELYAAAMKLSLGCIWQESDKDRFFTEGARGLLTLLILAVVICGRPEEQNLPALALHLHGDFLAFIHRLAAACPDRDLASRLREFAHNMEKDDRAVASSGVSGIITTLKVELEFLLDPAIAGVLRSSNFSLYSDEVDTVSWIMPLDYAEVAKKFNRLAVQVSLSAYLRTVA